MDTSNNKCYITAKGKEVATEKIPSPPLCRSSRQTRKPTAHDTFIPTMTPLRKKTSPTIRSLKDELARADIIQALNEETVEAHPLDK